MKNNNALIVCEQCFAAIKSREGNMPFINISVDPENKLESACSWCHEDGFDTLIKIQPCQTESQRQITDEMIEELINVYESNKDSLYELDAILDENGILDNGITDIHDTFEMGYNNALQYVFSVLGIKDYEIIK